MDARTLEALKASIKHWEENASATDLAKASVRWQSCALCLMFDNDYKGDGGDCKGCPVCDAGFQKCEGTPYTDAFNAKVHRGDLDGFRIAAQAELDFLRSLLPASEEE